MKENDKPDVPGEILIYQTGDDGKQIRVLLEGEKAWLTQTSPPHEPPSSEFETTFNQLSPFDEG